MHKARLEHITGNNFRLFFICDGITHDIMEFSGRSICNGLNPFEGKQYLEFYCDQWQIDFGLAKRADTKLAKAIMQCPFGFECEK